MKRPIEAFEIICNVCGTVISDPCHGSGFRKAPGNQHGKDPVWMPSRNYASLEELAEFDVHICNRCHVELSWAFPGGISHPVPQQDTVNCPHCHGKGKMPKPSPKSAEEK